METGQKTIYFVGELIQENGKYKVKSKTMLPSYQDKLSIKNETEKSETVTKMEGNLSIVTSIKTTIDAEQLVDNKDKGYLEIERVFLEKGTLGIWIVNLDSGDETNGYDTDFYKTAISSFEKTEDMGEMSTVKFTLDAIGEKATGKEVIKDIGNENKSEYISLDNVAGATKKQ